ncbi:hypothetical protein C2G38_2141012 [Gigaspora rosea]|uniref:Uncharacterized protein n=1 Tax=Gigaspora rosea TaxID=44941 RepID=A0A397VFY2_9GLOM|nr:hypothetical protein C2G38_2141012 [Gigaspora rosea]
MFPNQIKYIRFNISNINANSKRWIFKNFFGGSSIGLYLFDSGESSKGDGTDSFYLDIYIDSKFLQVETEQRSISIISIIGSIFAYYGAFTAIYVFLFGAYLISPFGFIHNGCGGLFHYCRVFRIIKDEADKRKPKNADDINFIYDVISVPYEVISTS